MRTVHEYTRDNGERITIAFTNHDRPVMVVMVNGKFLHSEQPPRVLGNRAQRRRAFEYERQDRKEQSGQPALTS